MINIEPYQIISRKIQPEKKKISGMNSVRVETSTVISPKNSAILQS
jgi:hypothetical protein